MTTQEAYEQAVKELWAVAHRKDTEMLPWLSHTIAILWERAKQEAVAIGMDAYAPHQVINLVNSDHFTRQAIQQMRDDTLHYGSLFKSNVVEGLGHLMQKLPEREPWIANALLKCLRRWELEAKPGPFIVTIEDLDYLEQWAAGLYESWKRAEQVYDENNFPWCIRPVRIGE